MLNYPSISTTEINSAYQRGIMTIGDLVLNENLKERYSILKSACGEGDDLTKDCLFLYLYAINSWCEECYNFITEEQLIAIVSKIEELQKVCCDFNVVSNEPILAPSTPIVHNGTWIENDTNNPPTIAELGQATTGSLLWYDVSTGGTSSIIAPSLPTIPGVYYFWVSQVNSVGESMRLKVRVTILPQAVTSLGLTACQTQVPTIVPVNFSGIDIGATVNIFQNGNPVAYPLNVDINTVQNNNYTVTQTLNGVTSNPTTFSVVVTDALVLGPISGELSPTINTQTPYIYSVVPVIGATDYVWTLPGGSQLHGPSIPLVFGPLGPQVVTVYAIGPNNCQSNVQSITINPVLGLIGTHFTNRTAENFSNRIYTAQQNLQVNPNDNVTIQVDIIDNPINAIITPAANFTVNSPTNNGQFNISIDGSGNYQGGTVHVRYTIMSSSQGAPVDSPSVIDIVQQFVAEPHCPPGYTLSLDGTYCYKDETMAPTITQTDYCLAQSQRIEYSNAGSRIYNPGFNTNSPKTWTPPAADIYAFMINQNQWRNSSATTGPHNRAGVWIDSNCDGTKDALVSGGKTTIATQFNNTGSARTIYVGVSSDNLYKLVVNGTDIIETTAFDGINFNIFHIFPVVIKTGMNYFNVVATGDGSVNDSVAMTIYDNTPLEIQNATDDTQLNILFTTGSLIGQHIDIATCPPGWTLDTSGGQGNYVCRRTLTTPTI